MKTSGKTATAWICVLVLVPAAIVGAPALASGQDGAACDRKAAADPSSSVFPFAETRILGGLHHAAFLTALLPIVLPLVTGPEADETGVTAREGFLVKSARVERGLICAVVAGAVAIGSYVIDSAAPVAASGRTDAAPDTDFTICPAEGDRT